MTKVVHCKKHDYDVYIGRGQRSKWGNPFSHRHGTSAMWVVSSREEAIEQYRKWLLTQTHLMFSLHELKDKTLGCWCKPEACHGDVLSDLCENLVYTGVGSRDTPKDVQELMRKFAAKQAQNGWTLRSGGANGADSAFEKGSDQGNGHKEIYLPWRGFNSHNSQLYKPSHACLSLSETLWDMRYTKSQVACPWDRLKKTTQLLMGRNCYQVLGRNLSVRSRFLICWTVGGSGTGGTGHAIFIAKKNGVPVYDLAIPRARSKVEEYVEQ